ncbi:hypothetical protein Raf01_47740 [Rugosimonospora africana]|uniref:Uncharacterized protein n=1 Tax=Rugosimonospora africana TaxID=556532 RepID=A0A8J3VRW2_9ACTN|nr:hypothetical protein Raf01_47740 [Rugosimonospora africana]
MARLLYGRATNARDDRQGDVVINAWKGLRRRRARIFAIALAPLLAVAVGAIAAPTPASAAVPGLTYVSAFTNYDSVVYKAVSVVCPGNLVVVGGGYDLIGAAGSVVLDDFIPSTNSLRVGAGEVVGPGEPADGTTLNWQVEAVAVCASAPSGYTIVSNTSAFATGITRDVTATCPGGTTAIGDGASLANGFGQISISDLVLSGNQVTARAYDDEDHYSDAWSISAYAICATGLPGLRSAFGWSVIDSLSPKWTSASCSTGQVGIGVGWSLSNGFPVTEQLLNIEALPLNGGPAQDVASEDADGYSGSWSIQQVQEICVDP